MSFETSNEDHEGITREEREEPVVEASLNGFPALVEPGAEVPAEVEVTNLAWSTIYDNFVDDADGYFEFPPLVRDAVLAEVENAGYELLGLAGFSLDIDTSDLHHAMTLDVVLTGNGGVVEGGGDD
jgi:hypothetical protein